MNNEVRYSFVVRGGIGKGRDWTRFVTKEDFEKLSKQKPLTMAVYKLEKVLVCVQVSLWKIVDSKHSHAGTYYEGDGTAGIIADHTLLFVVLRRFKVQMDENPHYLRNECFVKLMSFDGLSKEYLMEDFGEIVVTESMVSDAVSGVFTKVDDIKPGHLFHRKYRWTGEFSVEHSFWNFSDFDVSGLPIFLECESV